MWHHSDFLDRTPARTGTIFDTMTAEQRALWENWIDFHSPRVSRSTPPDPFNYFLLLLAAAAVVAIFSNN